VADRFDDATEGKVVVRDHGPRRSNLDPDWLRVGTDIVGGTTELRLDRGNDPLSLHRGWFIPGRAVNARRP
jgi:hypothetical protein